MSSAVAAESLPRNVDGTDGVSEGVDEGVGEFEDVAVFDGLHGSVGVGGVVEDGRVVLVDGADEVDEVLPGGAAEVAAGLPIERADLPVVVVDDDGVAAFDGVASVVGWVVTWRASRSVSGATACTQGSASGSAGMGHEATSSGTPRTASTR
jgi:hypothetical protein